MERRLLGLYAAAIFLAAVVLSARESRPWTLARLSNGEPDFQGYWTNGTYTQLERDPALGTREFFTPEEAAAYIKSREKIENSQSDTDIHYDNQIWQQENYRKIVPRSRTSLIFDPPDGRIPPLTPAAKALGAKRAEDARRRGSADSAETRTLGERCISWGNEGPPMLGSTYQANLQIMQAPHQFVIRHELMHGTRIVPIDGSPRLSPGIRLLFGDSRGRWDGDTLVVDTTNFTDRTPFRGPRETTRQDIFTSRELHVIERFTRSDRDTILYRFTVDDPATFTRAWSGEMLMHSMDGPIYEYACHEGNYGLANILRGARFEETKAQ